MTVATKKPTTKHKVHSWTKAEAKKAREEGRTDPDLSMILDSVTANKSQLAYAGTHGVDGEQAHVIVADDPSVRDGLEGCFENDDEESVNNEAAA